MLYRMKFFKHIILSIIALGAFSAPANAQTDVKALTGALAETIREYANYADTLAYRIAIANRKNPTVLLGIAEAYNMNQDFEKTKKYAMDALAIQPDFAPSYVLLGKHCQYKFEHYEGNEAYKDTAIIYYKKAMEVNPLYEDSYEHYADIMSSEDPQGVLQMYLRLRDQRPDLHINGTIAALQFAVAAKTEDDTLGTKMNLYKKAITTYEDAGNENLKDHELQRFCALLDLTAGYSKDQSEKTFYLEKLLSVANFGHERDVTNPNFLSYMLSANTNLTHYDEAIKNANELFTQADTAKTHYRFLPFDYRWHGVSLMSVDSLDAGVDRILDGLESGKLLANDDAVTFATREIAASQVNQMNKDVTNIVQSLMAKGEWDKAMHVREYQMSKKTEHTINDYKYIAEVAMNKWQATTDSIEKRLYLNDLFEIYTKIENEFSTDPDVIGFYYNHAGLIAGNLESHPKEGKAVPQFTKVFNLESSNPNRNEGQLATAANYLAVYYFFANDYDNALKYALVMMDYDSTYGTGEQIYNVIARMKPKTAKAARDAHRPL